MSGLAAARKKKPDDTPSPTPSSLDGSGLFFRHMLQVAGIGRKEVAYGLRVSHTLVDMWCNGEKNDPLTQAKNALALIVAKRPDLRVAVLTYIAGQADFDDALFARLEEVFGRKEQ